MSITNYCPCGEVWLGLRHGDIVVCHCGLRYDVTPALNAEHVRRAVEIVCGPKTVAALPDFDGKGMFTACYGMADGDREPLDAEPAESRGLFASWLPRIGLLPVLSPGLNDDLSIKDFNGRVLVFQWPRFLIEITIGRRA
jgi:hypothetical protein